VADANWLRAERRLTDAVENGQFQSWYPEPDDYAEIQEILGSCAVANGAYAQALEHYNDGLKYRPDGARLRLGRARSLVRLGQIEAAKPDLDLALVLRPGHGPTAAFAAEVAKLAPETACAPPPLPAAAAAAAAGPLGLPG
jgi:tetratricopeptide (TPR) repeat protein